jgi:hypothetical protein
VEGAVRREDRSCPWEEPDPPSTRRPTSPTSSSSSTSRRRPRLLPRRRAAPPLYTDVCTTTRGHRGEDDRFPPHVDAPAFEPRWNSLLLRTAAPPLVMPAFVPGWDNPFAGVTAFIDARPLSWPSLPLSLLNIVPCRSRPRRRAEPFALAFARVASRTRRPAPPCTPARARIDPGGKVGPWPLSSRVGRRRRVRPARTAAASPWQGASCTVAEEKGKGTVSLAAERALPPVKPTRTFVSRPRALCSLPPMASTRDPPRSPPHRPCRGQPLHWPWWSPCARALPHGRRRTRAHAPRTGLGHQHRRRADAAAPTPAMVSRDGHHPGLAPLRAQ